VTIATNMAGRGTDIKLGEGVRELGGLHIIGTERHESRRIDNQLRGRAGRQGDPGSTQFFVSLEDDLMRMFGSEKLKSMMKTLKIPEDQPLEHKWITSSIESAQKRVEGHNFDIRKRVVEYDDVMNRHRATIYRQRQTILDQQVSGLAGQQVGESEEAGNNEMKAIVQGYIFEQLRLLAGTYSADLKMLLENVNNIFPIGGSLQKEVESAGTPEKISELLIEEAKKQYEGKEKEAGGEDNFRQGERAVLLRVMDILWMEHIDAMTKMRESIGLQGYGQRDPLVEYKQEAYAMFQRLQGAIAFDTARLIYKVRIVTSGQSNQSDQSNQREMEEKKNLALKGAEESKGDFSDEKKELAESQSPITNNQSPKGNESGGAVRDPKEHKDKVGRNDPCPCGAKDANGRPIKYKKCCYPKYG
jgi:preprotein translocase subunit SecA